MFYLDLHEIVKVVVYRSNELGLNYMVKVYLKFPFIYLQKMISLCNIKNGSQTYIHIYNIKQKCKSHIGVCLIYYSLVIYFGLCRKCNVNETSLPVTRFKGFPYAFSNVISMDIQCRTVMFL